MRILSVLARNMHYLTFIPLILVSVLGSVNLLIAAVVSSGLVTCLIALSYVCHRAGLVKVWPKPFDVFNWSLYTSMIFLAIFATDWLALYISLLTNAANAAFMWASILLPCTDNFVMHTVRDRVPDNVARLPLMRRMALLIALVWATALTLMTAGAALPVYDKLHHPAAGPHRAGMIATYVLGFGPLLLAVPIQHTISHIYKKRVLKLRDEAQRQEAAAVSSASQTEQGQGQGQAGRGEDAV